MRKRGAGRSPRPRIHRQAPLLAQDLHRFRQRDSARLRRAPLEPLREPSPVAVHHQRHQILDTLLQVGDPL